MIERLPIPSESLREQALGELRTHIISGLLKPGRVYSASAIAAELGVSNGPVREAMITLVNDGLMEVAPNRGYRVVSLSDHDLENIAEIRTFLEIPAMVKLAGSPRVHEHRDHFSALVDEFFEAAGREDLVAFNSADYRFHVGLLALLDNERLTEYIGTLRDQTRQYGVYELAVRGELMNSAQEHRDILDALLAGDGAAVESLMHTHLRYLRWSGWSSPDLSPSRSEFRASDDPAALHDGQPRGRLRERRSELERVFREQQGIAVAPEVE